MSSNSQILDSKERFLPPSVGGEEDTFLPIIPFPQLRVNDRERSPIERRKPNYELSRVELRM